MGNEDDLRGLAKVMEFMRALSILFVTIHIYWYCYECIKDFGINIGVVDRILINFNKTAGLFSNLLWTKLFAVAFLGLSCLETKGVKNEKITWNEIYVYAACGSIVFFLNWWVLNLPLPLEANAALYTATLIIGYILLLVAGLWASRLLKNRLMEDVFNIENESFMQETHLMENEYSVNLPTRFYYQKKWNDGWINVVNPFRATMVLGTPGSGKSYAVVNNYIKQHIKKGFSMYIYDYKFDDLSIIAYNTLINNTDCYKVKPQFFVINFDNPRKSHRCNPINPSFMTDISDAYEAAYTIMLNLNRTWIQKQGDFFVESPIILLASIIWYLKIYKNGKYCTFPHAIEFLNKKYADIFTILTSYPELENYLSPFMDAWQGGAQDQLQGQIASAKIPLSRMISPQLYWVMTGDDFSLDINNPNEPKILCVGNNPDRQNIYSAALGLYNSRIVKLINKKGQLKSSFRTLFFLRKDRPNSNGLVPILVRITVNGDTAQFNTKLEVNPDMWDIKLGKAKGRTAEAINLNLVIDNLRAKMFSIYNKLLETKGYALPESIKNILKGIDTDRKTLLQYFTIHNEQYKLKVGNTTSRITYSRYELTKERIEEFIKKEYKLSDIPLPEIDFLFVEKFYLSLRNNHDCSNNTAMKFIQRFRSVFNFCVNLGAEIKINPFANFKFHTEKVHREVLTQEEINLIYNKKFSTQRLEQVRDIFIFCCYTGLSYSDVLKLQEDEIRRSFDKNLWIMTEQKKTNEKVNVMLLDIPLAIIDKYSKQGKLHGGRLFPVSTNQKMNEYLKETAAI